MIHGIEYSNGIECTEDELLDRVSAGLRNQVLQAAGVRGMVVQNVQPWSPMKSFLWTTSMVFSILWATMWSLLVVLCVVSIILVWAAPACWAIGCAPAAALISSKVKHRTEMKAGRG